MLLTWTCFQRVANLFHDFFRIDSCCFVRFPTYSAKVAVALVVLLFVLCVKMGWIGPPSLKEDDLVALKTFNDTYRTLARDAVNSVSLCLFRNPTSCAKDLTGVLCVCITVCLICALVQKAVCFSKIHMFGAIAVLPHHGMWTISEKQQKEVFMENPIRLLIQYGDLLVWNGDHSFAIWSKKDWGMVQLELEEDVTLACICLKWKGFRIQLPLPARTRHCKCLVNVIRLGHEPQTFWMIGERQIATSPAVEWNELFPSFWVLQDECKIVKMERVSFRPSLGFH